MTPRAVRRAYAAARPRCSFVELASASPMGQQAYERAIQEAITLAAASEFEFRRIRVTSLRHPVPAERRFPARLLYRSGIRIARLIGVWAYRGSDLVHRFDLRLPPAAGPEVVTIHDVPGLHFDDEGELPPFLAAGARRADVVIAPSQFAKREVVEMLGVDERRVRVIPYGLDRVFASPPDHPTDERLLAVPRPFVVHAAGVTKRKNLSGLAEAWTRVAAARDDVHLALCGPEDERRTRAFRSLERAVLLGRVSPPDVAWLMRHAAAVVVPSIYEGFGLPALEGMAAGAPVVAASAGALPEVCGGAALIVEPDGQHLADALLRVLNDRALARRLRDAGVERAGAFSWSRAAEQHLDAYRAVLEREPSPQP